MRKLRHGVFKLLAQTPRQSGPGCCSLRHQCSALPWNKRHVNIQLMVIFRVCVLQWLLGKSVAWFSSDGDSLARRQLSPSSWWLEGSRLNVILLCYTRWPAGAHILVLSSWSPLTYPGFCPLEWVSSDLHEWGCKSSQSGGQLFISHLWPLCLYEIMCWGCVRSFGLVLDRENVAVIYMFTK